MLQALFEQDVSGVGQTDARGCLLLANPRLCAMLGYSEAELLGRALGDLVHPSRGAELQTALERIAREGGRALEIRYLRKDGSSFWGLTHLTVVGHLQGTIRTLVIVYDVSDYEHTSRPVDALAERQRRLYETTLSNTPDLVYVFDLSHRFTYANPAHLQTWGRSWQEVSGKTCLEAGYPDWQAAMHDAELEQVIGSKCRVRGEVPFKGPQGDRIHDYIFVPVIGADGEVEAIAGTTRDITALKQAEQLMARQAQALELMVKGVPLTDVLDALCDLIDQHATERVCASIQLLSTDGQHLRTSAGRHMPKSWTQAVNPWPIGPEQGACGCAAYRLQPVFSLDIEQDQLWSPELKALAARHGFRACWSTPILSTAGTLLGTLALYYPRVHRPDLLELRLVDVITRSAGIAIERQRGEADIRTQGERLRLLWETAALMLTTEEPEALIRALFGCIAPHLELDIFLNYMFEEGEHELKLFSFAGISPECAGELASIAPSSALCGDMARTREPYSASFLKRSVQPGPKLLASLGFGAYVCVPLIFNERWLGTLAFASRTRDHFDTDEIEFLRTITRYLTIAYERLRLVKQLRDADRKKDDFIALLAHELRNPLAPLRNGLALMKLTSGDPTTATRAREIMERQLGHLVRLIEDLLDVSRIGLNKMQLRRAPVWLSDVLSNAIELARPAIDAADHELEVSLPSEPALLDADLTRLAQVFGNLLTNAAKYTPRRGRIALRAERQSEAVVVTVEDNGVGLQPDSLRSIFALFSQVDSGLGRATGGLGIGLALVKSLTEMHGGSVIAESPGAGHGSRFVVTLPLADAMVLEPGRPAAARPPVRKPWRRILVADDNRDAAESLATMLRMSGNEVHIAHDGLETFERTEALKPDVVVMDIGMPRMNGRDATRRIRAQPWGRDVVVVALTGWSQEADRRLSREAGCDDHLLKPVDIAQLEELIAELCDRTSGSRPTAAGELDAQTFGRATRAAKDSG